MMVLHRVVHAMLRGGSGSPVPRRRTFASAIHFRAGAAVPASSSAYGSRAKPGSPNTRPSLTRRNLRFAIHGSAWFLRRRLWHG
jgi:hypothetical protein